MSLRSEATRPDHSACAHHRVAMPTLAIGKANLTSLIERRSRFLVLTPNGSRHSAGMMESIERQLGTLPSFLRLNITLDRGTEFAGYGRLSERPGSASPQPHGRRAAGRTATAGYDASYPRTRTSHMYRELSPSSW